MGDFRLSFYYQLPMPNYQLPITNYQLPITNYYSIFLALKRNYEPNSRRLE
ncbi:MAG: hypothetical protein AAF630_12320 [Cyanobacteria bacterium P01_C01_bin.38]